MRSRAGNRGQAPIPWLFALGVGAAVAGLAVIIGKWVWGLSTPPCGAGDTDCTAHFDRITSIFTWSEAVLIVVAVALMGLFRRCRSQAQAD
jgi:hypothetical protein